MVSVDSDFTVQGIRCNSAFHGIVAFSRGRGITESSGWEDEFAARGHSGTANYYSVSGVTHAPNLSEKVVDDVLRAAPDPVFREMVVSFSQDTGLNIPYDYRRFRMEPMRPSGQIHILRYLKSREEVSPPMTFRSFVQAILRNLNPVYVLGKSYSSILRSLNRIHYQCESCGAENPLLIEYCHVCIAPRPPIRVYALTLFLLRAIIDMSYFLYVIVAIVFLFFTVFHLR